MKKRLLSLALALVMVCGLLPVTASAAATVTEIVPPKYDRVEDAYNGLAAVNVGGHYQNGIFVGGKWGFIDATGKEVVPCQYSNRYDAPEFHEGLARVQPEGKGSGFIDTTGKEVVPCKYYDVGNFSEGLAAVELDDKWGFIDTTGKEVVPCKYNHNNSYFYNPPEFHDGRAAVQDENYKWGFIDTTGKEVVPCQYDDYDAPEFHNGLAVVEGSTGQMKNGKTVYAPGVIDTQGNVVVAFGKYHYVGAFSEGLAAVRIGDNANTAKWGFINTTGKEVVPCKYDDVNGGFEDWGGFPDGLAAVRVGDNETGKWGFVDTTGKEVVPCTLEYDEVENFSDGLAAVAVNVPYNGFKYGFIDKTGAEVIPCKYDKPFDWESMNSPAPEFHDGLAVVQTSNGWGCIDLQGNEVVPCQYGGVKLLSAGLVAVKVGDKWGVLRVEGLPTELKPNQAQDVKKAQEAIITKRREETAQERREKAIREQQNNPRYQEYLKANREFLAEHIEERDYIYTIVTDDIQNCSDEICAGLTTDAEKVLAIHKWVTENIYYDYPLLSQSHPWPTAQTVFDKKSYVCSGYTILFQALCWAQKIPCVSVAGPTRNGYHAWNAVQVDGEWSWVDATWDTFNKYYGGDRWIKGDQRMDYYRCSSEFLSTDHKVTPTSSQTYTLDNNGKWVVTDTTYFWCYTTNGVNANLPDQSKEETQQIIEQSNKLLEEEKPLEERLAELAMENPTLSGWAKDEVVAAIKANLVPADLMDGYNTNITRQEFCSLMVMMLEQATGKKALDYIAEKGLTYQSPFTDTNLPTVGYAYTLGIVKGTGDTTFNPNGSITRQEAATMLGRAGRLLGLEAKSGTDFADRQDFPSWAVEGIAYVSGLTDPVSQKKVMEGTGGGFTPKGTYTREQGIITALRLFRCGD